MSTAFYCKWCAGSGEYPPGSGWECGTCHGEGEIVINDDDPLSLWEETET